MTARVFIDGAAGTTGLDIAERLSGRADIELVAIADDRRKDAAARADAMQGADVAILCLPDAAAREAADLAAQSDVRLIDASSAHRVDPAWTYGFPELRVGQRAEIAASARVSNPGCYAIGFVSLVAPLVSARLLPADIALSCHAVSGFSGGGKALVERYANDRTIAWRGYAFTLDHKHLPEMRDRAGLHRAPLFAPAVIPAHRGRIVEVPLLRAADARIAPPDELLSAWCAHYADAATVRVGGLLSEGELLLRGDDPPTDRIDIALFASADGLDVRLVARLDNLGKGAAGSSVQNLNLMIGAEETRGLRL